MAEEQSIIDQIAAMEKFAIEAKQNISSGKYEEAGESLRDINTQGRRLEWKGGISGLKHLPEMEEVISLKKKISEARAAAQRAIEGIDYLKDTIKAIKQLNQKLKENEQDFVKVSTPGTKSRIKARIQAVKNEIAGKNARKMSKYKRQTGESISILIQVLKESKVIVESEPWLNLTELAKAKLIRAFLRGHGYFSNISWKERRTIWNTGAHNLVVLEPLPIKNVNLQGFSFDYIFFTYPPLFELCNLEYAGFRHLKLENASFIDCNLKDTDFSNSYLSWVHFNGSDLTETEFNLAVLKMCYFKDCILNKTRLIHATLIETDLNKAKVNIDQR